MASSAKKIARKSPRAKPARAKARPKAAARKPGAKPARAPKPAHAAKGSRARRAVKAGAAKPGRARKAAAGRRTTAPASAAKRLKAPSRPAAAASVPQRGAPAPVHPAGPARSAPLKPAQFPQAPSVPGEPELRISDEAVAKATGRDWTQWCEALDAAAAQAMPHSDIARLVMERFRLGPWWSQMVTVGYEQLRGLRVKHQKSEGFEISASKTLAAPAERVYAAWNQDAERGRWLGQNLRVRGATPIKSLRLAGSDGISTIDVALNAKGQSKTQVTVQHSKLKDAAEATRMKLHWAAALDRLRAAVEAR